MNRLIVTMMLVFAIAVGLAKLANADTPNPAPGAPTDQTAIDQQAAKDAAAAKAAAQTAQDAKAKLAAEKKAAQEKADAKKLADAQKIIDDAKAKEAANTPGMPTAVFTDKFDGFQVQTTIAGGTIASRVALRSSCSECTGIQLKPLDSTLLPALAQLGDANKIEAKLLEINKADATAAIKKEEKRAELQEKLDDKKAICETSPASEVMMDKDDPYIKYVNFDARLKGAKRPAHTSHNDESEVVDDADTTTYDTPESVATGEGFSEKDRCLADKLSNDPDGDVKAKLVASTLNEFLKLDAKFNAGLITPGSKDAIRYANLKSYVTSLSKDQKYAGIIKQVTLQLAMAKDKNFDALAVQAAGSPQMAQQLRQSGLSNSEIGNYNTLIALGKSASSASGDMTSLASLQQMQSKNIQGLVAKIDQNANKQGGAAGGSYLAEYDKAGGVDSDYDKAHKEAMRIATLAGAGHLLSQWDESEPNTLDPRGLSSRTARFANRTNVSSGTPFINATAYAPNLNTGNSFANSIPQAGQSQYGTSLGAVQNTTQNTVQNYVGRSSNGFSIPPRSS